MLVPNVAFVEKTRQSGQPVFSRTPELTKGSALSPQWCELLLFGTKTLDTILNFSIQLHFLSENIFDAIILFCSGDFSGDTGHKHLRQ